MKTPDIVLLGGPNSGKTHYAGQLYGRLQSGDSSLKLRKNKGAPDDLSPLKDVLECLEDGNAASHTRTDTWEEVKLPLIDRNGLEFDMHWPDYGGEQLKHVFSNRMVNSDWQEALLNANSWVLLIRLNAEITYGDALEQLVDRKTQGVTNTDSVIARSDQWDANAEWVEKLQILLHVSQQGTVKRLDSPKLAVLLSCYDEIENREGTPSDVLIHKLPLLASFLKNNWKDDAVSIWGLSALGQTLDKDSNAEAFVENGPETQGWIIAPDGTDKTPDITLPLKWLLDEME
jgi:hypothetical protein